jgi:glucose/arabinose dehydrogenase
MVFATARALTLSGLVALQVSAPQACDERRTPEPAPGTTPPVTTPPGGGPVENFTAADGTRYGVQIVASDLELPWSLAWTTDGRMFFTERPGRVRVFRNGAVDPQPMLTIPDVAAVDESGALGLALHPDFATNRFVYVMYTTRKGGSLVNRIVRYREVANTLGEPAVIIDDIPGANIHDGGRIRFGPDGKLYVTTGDAADENRFPQDLGSLAGKILRLNDDGTTPRDNPLPSPIYTYGHRNPQGLDWHPVSGELWATEHGPTGNDEVNLILPGRNYGWPIIQGSQTAPGMVAPVLVFTPSVAPSGASFYRGSLVPGFRNDFFFACLRGVHIHRVRFDPSDPRRIVAQERLLESRFGRLRDVVNAPDGALYFCTSNRSGTTTPGNDRIVRIVSPQ